MVKPGRFVTRAAPPSLGAMLLTTGVRRRNRPQWTSRRRSGVDVRSAGTVSVDITAHGGAAAPAARAAGGTVRDVSPAGIVRADVPLSALDTIVGRADVDEVKPVVRPLTGTEPADRRAQVTGALRAGRPGGNRTSRQPTA
jgi:hypothetical protein